MKRFALALVALAFCLLTGSSAEARGGGSWTSWARRPWIARDVPGVIVWLPPEKIAQSANVITSWPDQSGQGNNATPQNSPAYAANALNGYGEADLHANDGGVTSQYFTLPNSFTGLTSAEIFFVVKADAYTAGPYGLHDFTNSGQENAYGFSNQHIFEGFGSTSRPDTGIAIVDITSAYRLYNCRSAPGAFSTYLNTTQQFTTASNTVGFNATPVLGKTTAARFGGHIVEVFMANRVLGSDRNNFTGYIKQKYPTLGLP